MNAWHYDIRNYQPADFDRYVQLNCEAERLEPMGRCVTAQLISEQLGRPGYRPERELFVVEIAGDLIGFMDVAPEPNIGRVILNCWIHPEHRRRGLATRLLSGATQRARELGAKVAHANAPEGNLVAQRVLSKLGFRFVRRFLELRLGIDRVDWQAINRVAPGWRYFQRGEEDKLTQVQNRSFAGTWGYNLNSVEEITYRAHLSSFSPEDVILEYEEDKLIGYCWTTMACSGGVGGEREGRIFMLGVDPDYRGRGVGKKLLLLGLSHLKSKGATSAELSVDSENPVACALYRSIGFEVRIGTLWYEKAIGQDTAVR